MATSNTKSSSSRSWLARPTNKHLLSPSPPHTPQLLIFSSCDPTSHVVEITVLQCWRTSTAPDKADDSCCILGFRLIYFSDDSVAIDYRVAMRLVALISLHLRTTVLPDVARFSPSLEQQTLQLILLEQHVACVLTAQLSAGL